jgi:hypothetical protein
MKNFDLIWPVPNKQYYLFEVGPTQERQLVFAHRDDIWYDETLGGFFFKKSSVLAIKYIVSERYSSWVAYDKYAFSKEYAPNTFVPKDCVTSFHPVPNIPFWTKLTNKDYELKCLRASREIKLLKGKRFPRKIIRRIKKIFRRIFGRVR